jgi:hypothetical protein
LSIAVCPLEVARPHRTFVSALQGVTTSNPPWQTACLAGEGKGFCCGCMPENV